MHALRLAEDAPDVWDGGRPVPPEVLRSGVERGKRCFDGPGKALVAVSTGRTPSGLAAYLAALESGHAVLLKDGLPDGALLEVYRPEHLVDPGTQPVPPGYRPTGSLLGARVLSRSTAATGDIHPELALLMTTSGSSGRPKAVRLSYRNVSANAHAIAAALGIDRDDVGITSLPTDYSFGLSVVNSHLVAGARLVLTAWSPTSRRFWQLVDHAGVTDFGAVPVSYRLLHRMGWHAQDHPSLRLAYQAGGALEPELVAHFAREMAGRRGGFCPMYGATEATARMTVLPPDLAPRHPRAVGRPVPGGRVRLAGCADGGVGEIVYEGPNVMMGYARSRADLAGGDTTGGVLRTGDLGYLDDGVLHVVGRKDRQVKLHGKRIVLDDVERLLARVGPAAAVPTGGEAAAVFVEGGVEAFHDAWLATLREFDLPAECLPLRSVPSLPRTASGKVDFARLRSSATAG